MRIVLGLLAGGFLINAAQATEIETASAVALVDYCAANNLPAAACAPGNF
jgi:hypothetical protein